MSAAATPAELSQLARARELALRARGHVSPNPLVGAVVMDGARVIGEGWHAGPGRPHAEIGALGAAGAAARGATLVCTLEPCSHHGRTPPCTDALIAAGVARVVVGTLDPLERRRAQGIEVLRAAGIEVVPVDGEQERACRAFNSAFITWAATGRPEVTLKLATSLDGRIATATGESRWITGPDARRRVHAMRAASDAVAVGVGTALADDPALTARDVEGPVRQPTRVVFDSAARLPLDSALVRTAGETAVIVVTAEDAPRERVDALSGAGAEVIGVGGDPTERVGAALDALGGRDLQSLLVEGGAGLAAGMLSADAVDRVVWMLAPMLIGGTEAPGAVGGRGLGPLTEVPRLSEVSVEREGEDTVISGRLTPLPGDRS